MKFLRINAKKVQEPPPQPPSARKEVKNIGEKRSVKRAPRPDPRAPLGKNTELEGYKFERVIGRGSFSLVYQAVEIDTGHEVVIKEYFPKHYSIRQENSQIVPLEGKKMFTFGEGFKQFFNEAMALNKISHPHVLKTHNMFRANKTAYLVSLNIGGRDLKWFLSTVQVPMDQPLVLKVFLPILSALNFLHGSELLHLDIKPANILLQPNSESLLLDFGAAQKINSNQRQNNMQTLTHGFAPPEQYNRKKTLGPWTDIYAVAATLFYGIACKPPAKSKDSKTESRLNVNEYGDKYPRHLIEAVNRSLAYDPYQRFDNVDEFAAALLEGSKWSSLRNYEVDVMRYDRFEESTRKSQDELRRALEII